MLHCHFWDAQNDVSACVQHRVVGAAPLSDTAMAAGEASPIATDDLPAPTYLSPAESVPAGSASAAAEVPPAVVDDVPVIADNPSAAALPSSPSATLSTSTPAASRHAEKAACKAARAARCASAWTCRFCSAMQRNVQCSIRIGLLSARMLQGSLRCLHACG
jgi:hypothetical protein